MLDYDLYFYEVSHQNPRLRIVMSLVASFLTRKMENKIMYFTIT